MKKSEHPGHTAQTSHRARPPQTARPRPGEGAFPRRPRPLVAVAAALATVSLIAGACTDSGEPPELAGPGEVAIGLQTDLSCDELVEASRTDAMQMVEFNRSLARMDAETMDAPMSMSGEAGGMDVAADATPAAGAAAEGGGAPGQVVAGTNNQEEGVDEGDILKTDGERIVALSGTTLRVVSLDGSPQVDGTLVLASDVDGDVGEMFLRGDEAVVLIPTWGNRALPEQAPQPGGPAVDVPAADVPAAETSVVPFEQAVRVLRVDISDAAAPTLVEESVVEGALVASRMVDASVRVVLRSPSPLAEQMWALEDESDVDDLFEDVGPDDLLPAVSIDGEVSALGGCGDVAVMAPTAPGTDTAAVDAVGAGYQQGSPETVTVLSIGEDLSDMSPVSVSGLADVVYASTDSLYVTNTGWSEGGPNTFVHHFDTSSAGPAQYTGSGIVPGRPLNQYSLSESGEQLRIVTTTEDPAAFEEQFIDGSADVAPAEGGDPTRGGIPVEDLPDIAPDPDGPTDIEPRQWVPPTEGRLTVLEPAGDGTLSDIGSIEDLGVGEEVQSVRFLGDMAYVVTFRRTDPLYAIDLSDPTNPTALGELKITGFSEYLHPVGDGLLLGIGREATEEGMDTGFKASLFDVSDPADPVEIDKWVVPDAWSEVGNDPHAFTWDPVSGFATFPLEQYAPVTIADCPPDTACAQTAPEQPAAEAVVLSAGPDGLTEVARLSHDSGSGDQWLEGIRRSVVIDRDLWTMSHTGLGLTDADSPGAIRFVAF